MKKIMDLNPYYITGFCDGESTFTYSRRTDNKNDINLYFAIKLIKNDSDLLIAIRQYFNVGIIYETKERLPRKFSGYSRAGVYYRVTNLKDLLKIVVHFDKYPLMGKKLESYKVWKKILELKLQHFRSKVKVDKNKLNSLLNELSSLTTRGRNKRPSWVNEYIKNNPT